MPHNVLYLRENHADLFGYTSTSLVNKYSWWLGYTENTGNNEKNLKI